MYGSPTGDKLITADGDLVTVNQGEMVRVFNIHILASGTAVNTLTLRNGGVGGTIYVRESGTASTGRTIDYGVNGKLFPLGCYVSQSDTSATALITYRKDIS